MVDKVILQARDVGDEAARLTRAHAEEVDRLAAERNFLGTGTAPQRQIFVRPSGGRPVAMGGGQFYPPEGMFVSANDVYTARRLRDRSLEQVEPPSLAPVESAQPQEAGPINVPEEETARPEANPLGLPAEEDMPLTRDEIIE
jgi:hypothetical protein